MDNIWSVQMNNDVSKGTEVSRLSYAGATYPISLHFPILSLVGQPRVGSWRVVQSNLSEDYLLLFTRSTKQKYLTRLSRCGKPYSVSYDD